MFRANAIPSVVALAAAVLLPTGLARSQTCEPAPDGFGCTLGPCGAIPEDQCLSTVFHLDVATGAIKTEACACQDFNLCHVEPGDASFFAVGACPTGEHCELVAFDTDNDGINDRFAATCLADTIGVCCADIDDGPVAFDTCVPTGPDVCAFHGGIFHGIGPGCAETQACCFPFAGSDYCVQLNPSCCLDSGGIPKGVGSTCDATNVGVACPQVCGGIAGIPCDDPNAFCQLPPGGCCCDFMGVCMLHPDACIDLWDPVCGCDGQTYSNACYAAMAGMSVDHHGVCGGGACCVLTSPTGPQYCFDGTKDECADAGGEFGGPGSACGDPNTIPCGEPVAACCLPDGLCVNLPIDVCLNEQGVPSPPGVTCDVVFCGGVPTGACCIQNSPNGVNCLVSSHDNCLALGGQYQGNNTTCPTDASLSCFVPTGACCISIAGTPESVCEEVTEKTCLGVAGEYQGDGTTCSNVDGTNVCSRPIGACCVQPPDGATPFCTQVTVIDCLAQGGKYLGDGSSCPFNGTAPCDFLIGACCTIFPSTGTEECFEGSRKKCANAGGDFQGEGTVCPPNPNLGCATIPSACCFVDGACEDIPFSHCVSLGGEPGPLGSDCVGHFCTAPPTGACCLPDAVGNIACEVTTQKRCADLSGAYQGDDTACPADATTPCGPPIGACCTPIPGALDPICEQVTEQRCHERGGAYQGDGTPCVVAGVSVCPSLIGACCSIDPLAGTEHCFEGTRFECANAGGEFLGEGSHCPTDPNFACSTTPSACCFDDGNCVDMPFVLCVGSGGRPGPLGSRCELLECPIVPTGACCLSNSAGFPSCEETSNAKCGELGGSYQGDNTSCPFDGTVPCGPPTGACCRHISGAVDSFCEDTTEAICSGSGGHYLGNGTTCPPDGTNPCPPPTGACCVFDPATNNAGCFIASEQACANEFGSYLGDGSVCPPDADLPCATPRGACCFTPAGTIATTCVVMGLDLCHAVNGRYLGDGSTCPDDPALACPSTCGALCGVFDCISGCGTIVQGVECLLFETAFGTFLLSDYGPFGVGDRVRIAGCTDPFCDSICQAGDGCIHNFAIEPCGEVCGGIAGIPCSAATDYCRFPIGTCGDGDVQGICVPVPDNGCPENYDPVCGCDGVTYGNDCEAAAAGISIAHRGPCDPGPCATVRRLGDPSPTYCPGQRKTVHISVNVPDGTSAIAVEDAPPAGWEVVAISHEGTFDATNGKVKWGPFIASFPQGLNYVVVPSASDTGPKCFTGAISIDGINRETCGEQCLDELCRPFHPVDLPQPACDHCPLSDCNGCDHGSCQDGHISLCEVISFACSWKTGCNDALADLTRAAFIWLTGECYCWNEAQQNYFPSPCASSSTGLCSDVSPRGDALEPVAITDRPGATARVRLSTVRDGRRSATRLARITIRMNAPVSTSASALEFHLPAGWSVMDMGGGVWDEANRKVKWGPFMEQAPRTVFVTARKTLRNLREIKGDTKSDGAMRGFRGTVSFDGENHPVIVRRSTASE